MTIKTHSRRLLTLFSTLAIGLTLKAQVGQVLWQDNFNTLDTTLWNAITGNGCEQPTGCGWGNQELEYYSENNVTVEEIPGEPGNFALVLEAKRETIGSNQFTSGKITSENKIAVRYGAIEVRMMAPKVETGLWPALWLLGTNMPSAGWPACGEIDMVEMGHKASERVKQGFPATSANNYLGANLIWHSPLACSNENPTCAASIANDAYYNQPYVSTTSFENRFFIYRLYWDDKSIRFTVEDNNFEYDLYTNAFPIGSNEQAFTKPFYLLVNLAVGGNFTDAATPALVTAPLPAKLYVDYIRIRKWNGKGEVITAEDIIANAGADQKVSSGAPVRLNASGSYGNILSYSWSVNGVQLATGDTATINLTDGSHIITLTVRDGFGNTSTDKIVVQVGENLVGEVIWEENFDTLDTTIWNTVNGNGCEGESGCGFGNQELQFYSTSNLSIEPIAGEDGNKSLVIEARRETNGSNEFTSGKVTTENKLAIKYGVVEVRMKTPDVETGLWPAAWLLGSNHNKAGWPYCGEIDMMEMGHKASERERQGYPGTSANNYTGANLIWHSPDACSAENPTCAASIAYDTYYNQPYTPTNKLSNRYIVYRLYWDENNIRLTVVDNNTEHDLYTNPFPIGNGQSAFRQPFYLLLNLAVGGNFTDAATPTQVTAALPAKMYIDYIKVRKWKGKGEVSYNGGKALANAGADMHLTDTDKNGVEAVTLDASGSYGNIVSYVWSEGGVQLATGKNPTINLPNGSHYLLLTVTDSSGNTSNDEVFIDIREIIWEDHFDNFNTAIWNYETGDGCSSGAGCGWGNQELQYYQQNNIAIEPVTGEAGNQALVIEARHEQAGNSQFTSGKVTTENKLSLRYGLLEVRMKTPDVETGLWPAAWLLGANHAVAGWPQCGEIDLMEMGQSSAERSRQGHPGVSPNNYTASNFIWYSPDACSAENLTCAASIAYDTYYNKPYVPTTGLNNRFVKYRLYWNETSIRFTIEDEGIENDLYTGPFPVTASSAALKEPFYMLLNLAVGGNFTDAATPAQVTAPLPGKMLVDYVRLMKWSGKGEVALGNGLMANAGTDIIILDKDKNGSETLILDGSESSDFNGTITGYSWSRNNVVVATGVMPEILLPRGVHTIELTVADNDGNSATDIVIVTVSSGGASPVAVAGADTTLFDDDGDDLVTFSPDASKSYDPNNSPLTFSWLANGQEIAIGIAPELTLKTGRHIITLVVINEDSLSASDEIIVTVTDPDNLPPVASAGTDQWIDDDDGDDIAILILDASGSSDADGYIENYSWLVNNEEIATGISPTINLSTGKYTIMLTVTDDDGISATDSLTVVVHDPDNLAPMANAGNDTLIIDNDRDDVQLITLDASLSSDSDGEIVSFSWSYDGMLIASGNAAEAILPVGLHTIILTVTDNDGETGSDTVLVKIAQLPIAKADNDTLVFDTDGDNSEIVELNGSGSSDPYGQLVLYEWFENNVVIATGATATVSFSRGTHSIMLIVTDNDGFTASDSLTIIVANPDNKLPNAHAGSDIEITDLDNNGSEPVSLDGSGSSDPDGYIYSYRWYLNGQLVADSDFAEVVLPVGTYHVILEVTDNEGAKSADTLAVAIKRGACSFDACTNDYTAKVVSGAERTTIKFIPAKIGTGDQLCLLYYGTNPVQAFPANIAIPYEPFQLQNVNPGQTVYFYFTYNLSSGGEQNTSACKHSFTVGDCYEGNLPPVANAGADLTIGVPAGSSSALIELNAKESFDPDGTITSYVWAKGTQQIAEGDNASVSLPLGSHTIYLIVTDNQGDASRDKLVVTVEEGSGLSDFVLSNEVILYPVPVTHTLSIVSNIGKVGKVQLLNSFGTTILEKTSSNQIDMSEIPEGIYILLLNIDGKQIFRRIVKI
ncbi:MAG: family 16 glycosylhydrolase [Bacteroidales bacterium]|nr:family 16 glycosylhydrolase [Bacteroidales bacterium]